MVFDECYNFVKFLPLFSIYLEILSRENAKIVCPALPGTYFSRMGRDSDMYEEESYISL